MNEYQIVLGAAAAAFAIVGPFLYIRSMLRDGTKPHPFTWLLFSILDATVFFVQIQNGGGPGSWLLGTTAVLGAIVFLLSLKNGEKRISRVDWICLCAAFLAIAVWVLTSNPLYAVILASATEIIAKVPTFRKSYLRPNEESLTVWLTGIVNFSLSIAALSSITTTTALFPAVIVVTNLALVAMILLRRRKLGKVSA